jgi:leucyl/phenylalanyl-tRNA--protein transferase
MARKYWAVWMLKQDTYDLKPNLDGHPITCILEAMSAMYLTFSASGIDFAYRHGIFPMYNHYTDEIEWYRPDPRTIIPLDGFHISRSLAKTIRQGRFEVTIDADFEAVMRGCGDRPEGTWITQEFIDVYGELHRRGMAHSVEVWNAGRLVGGTYGVALGAAFMAESMFHYETDASKVALAALVQHLRSREFQLLDTQFLTPHLASLGAIEISHKEYYDRLRRALRKQVHFSITRPLELPNEPGT